MKKCSKTLLGLALAAAMSLSLIVPASAVYCPHDYYADAEKEQTLPVRLELPEGCSVLVCRNLRVIGSVPVAE